MTLLSRGWWARGRGGYATLAVIAAAAIAFFVCQWLPPPPASASNPEAPLAAAPGISYSQAISDTSVETNASITLRFRLRRLTGDAGHGGITVSFPDLDRANSSGSSSSYDSVDGSVSTKRYTNGASKVSYFPSGYSPIHNEDGSTGTAGHLIVESDDTDWPARDYRILELNVTPKQSGSFRIYYRFWLCGDQYDDCTRRPHSSQSDQVDQQGWHVGVYTVDVTNQASGPFARNSAEDFDTLDAADNESPKGIWSDETTMWVADWSDEKIYAYSMSNKGRVSSKDFDTLDDAGNDNPEGIWSDGTTMWVVDSSDAKIYAYNMSNKARVSSKDFDTLDAAGNDSPEGIWSDGTTMWVADWSDEKIYAYNMSNKARVSSKDFDTLDAASNGSPTGIWSDGTTMWVADSSDDKIYAYDMSNKGRVSSKDFDTLDAASNGSPTGIWSDRETVWVADSSDDKIFAYNAPEMAPAPTQNQNRSPSVSHVSPSSALVSLYTGDRQTFTARATDPDNNLKSYNWFVGGTEEDSGVWRVFLPTGPEDKSFSHRFSTAGTYSVKATFTDTEGESDSVSWTVVVIDPSRPSVDRVSPTQESLSLETGDSQAFTVRATDADNDLTKWKWVADWAGFGFTGHTEPEASFALTGNITNPFSYTFQRAGDWTVTVTFTDSRGESGSVSWEVEVTDPNSAPTVSRVSPLSPVSLYTGDRQTFEASGTDPDDNLKSYEWFVKDRSEESSPIWFGVLPTGSATDDFSHTFGTAGPYTVKATFTDKGGLSDSASWTVVVRDPSRPSVDRVSPTQESLSLETGDSQAFTVRATDADNDLTKWKWVADWAGFGFTGHTEPEASFALTGNITNPFSYTFQRAGDWTVTVTFTDSRGESGSVSWEVEVTDPNQAPSVTIDSPLEDPVSLTTGDSQTFRVRAIDPDDNISGWEWFVDDVSKGGQPLSLTGDISRQFSHTFSSAGSYTVKVTFTDSDGLSDSVSWEVQAGLNRGPDLAITITEQITPVVGKSMSIPVLLTNMGGSSSGPFNINVFFRNLDEETDAGTSITAEMSQAVIADRETGMIGNLDARGSLDGEQQGFTVPRSLDPGEYSLCVQIEYINPVAESDEDESNNTYCTPAYVLPDMGDDFPEEIQTFHFQDYYIYRHLIGHPAEFEYGDYWVFVPTKYTSPQEIADGINGRTFGAAKDRSNRIKLYRGLILEIARQKETHSDIFFDFVEVKDRVVGAGELADLSHEIAQAYSALEGDEVLLAHLEHLDGLSEIFKNGLVFGSLSLDVIISEAVNRSIEIEEAQKTLDILAKLPMDDAWAAAIRLAGEDLNQMTSPEAMERWGQAVEENLDEIVKAISEIIITKAATKTVLVVAGKIIGVKIVLLTAPISLTVGLAITAIYITIDQTGDFWEEISLATASAQVYASLYANDEKDKDKLLAYTKFAFYQHLYEAAYNRLLNNNLIFNLGENKPNQHKDSISKRRDFALAAIVDAPWNPAEDFNGPGHLPSVVGSLGDGISSLRGIWSDGATMWVGAMWRVGNGIDFRILTYDMATKAQVTGKVKDIYIPIISVRGIWSDGTTMWVVDEVYDVIHAYTMSDMYYDANNDFVTLRAAGNRDPKGIWSDGMTMWVADGDDDKIYAYKMSDKYRDVDKDFDTLRAAGNRDPKGIWSDGITMWVADGDDDKIYAYSMKNSKEREEAKEFNIAAVSDIGINEFPEGIWSDGTTMWVADGRELKIFAYATAPPTTPASPCSTGNAVADAANNPGLVADCEVLLAARDTLAGTASLNWSPDTPITAWDGVTVGGTPQRVTGLTLVQEQLTGEIPPELGGLSNLTRLSLWGNQLTGEIPPELGGLSNLTLLDLGSNQLTGEIPPELGGLSNLTGLYLDNNQLTGEIPPELGGLSNLTLLFLHRNQLTGEIPPELGGLSNLTGLYLDNNQLTGEIPPELGGLSNLTRLSLWGNQLTGEIPPELGGLSNLTGLYLDNNQLTGEIPPELGGLSNLTGLYLDNNQLTGEIPPELGGLSKLTRLSLWGNQLTGEIPPELGGLSNLQTLDLSDNRLLGEIPDEFKDLTNLHTLNLQGNQLAGGIPRELSGLTNLQTLDLSDNDLSGRIPANLANLVNLGTLRLGGNQFDGCIPAALRDVTSNDLADLGLPFCDVLLSGLTINPGELAPQFDPGQTEYTAETSASQVTVTPTNDHNATFQFFDEDDILIPDADGMLQGHQVDVSDGNATIRVIVTSQDTEATHTYVIEVIMVGLPGAPVIAVPITPGPASLTVSWTPPAGGTAITSYDLRYIESDAADKADANWTVEEGVWTVGTLSYTVTGLTGGAQYDVQVRAVTSAGEGPWSVTATEVPTAGATRSFSTSTVALGGQLVVTITAMGYGPFGGVAETLPSGFSYVSSSLSDDAVTAQDQELSFALFGETEFTYTVTAPDAAGSYPFSGILTNSDKEDVPVGGALSVTVGEAADVTSRYDANGNGLIEKSEVIQAINDYLFGGGGITKADVIRLINVYLFS